MKNPCPHFNPKKTVFHASLTDHPVQTKNSLSETATTEGDRIAKKLIDFFVEFVSATFRVQALAQVINKKSAA